MVSAEERRMLVLRAIVEDYVATHEPVGSKALTDRHELGVSPATIRNDMATLEVEGYIIQPHTSAGRIPTDKGYRFFVDRLATVKAMSKAEKKAIETFLDSAVDLDEVVFRAGRLLAQLTGQAAFVQYPSLSRSGIRHVELVQLTTNRLLVVIITDTARVEQRNIEFPEDLDAAVVFDLRTSINIACAGRQFSQVDQYLQVLLKELPSNYLSVASKVVEVISETLSQEREERIVLTGTANLVHGEPSYDRDLRQVLEAIEEQVVLLKLLSEMSQDAKDLSVRIGHETKVKGFSETAIVASGYASSGQPAATIGAIGPTRMDYPTTMAAVRAVARYMSRILS